MDTKKEDLLLKILNLTQRLEKAESRNIEIEAENAARLLELVTILEVHMPGLSLDAIREIL